MLTLETLRSDSIRIGQASVTLEARTLRAWMPGGGVVWTMPSAVLVESQAGQRRMPIVSVTTLLEFALIAAIAVAMSVALARIGKEAERS